MNDESTPQAPERFPVSEAIEEFISRPLIATTLSLAAAFLIGVGATLSAVGK